MECGIPKLETMTALLNKKKVYRKSGACSTEMEYLPTTACPFLGKKY